MFLTCHLPEGTAEFLCPHTVATGEYTHASDIFALGVTVVELTDDQKKNLDIHSGVVVREVSRGPGAMVGLRPGDIITNLDNRSVDSVETFTRIARDLPDNRSISMRVIRQGRASYITFRLAE